MARVHAAHTHGTIRRAVEGGAAAGNGDKAKAGKKHKHGGGDDDAKGAKDSKDAKHAKGSKGAGERAQPLGAGAPAAGGMGGCPMMGGSDGAVTGQAQLGATAAPAGLSTLPIASAPISLQGAPEDVSMGGSGAPAAAVQLSPQAATLIDSAAAGTDGSAVAQQVFAALKQGGAAIDVVDDAQFAQQYGERTAGLFDPGTNRMAVPTRVANDPAKLRLILLHEGVHWLQANVPGGAEGLGGPIGQALQGAGAVRATQLGAKADSHHDEAQAYLIEALTANQLGTKDSGLGVDSSGRTLGYDQILAKVRATPEYA